MTLAFLALVGALAVLRLAELGLSKRNEARLIDRGGQRVADDGFVPIVLVHAGWFVAIVVEWAWAPWAGAWSGTLPLLGLFAAAEALRVWTILTLGARWTTRVVVLPGAPLIDAGPYRWLEHPNYLAVSVGLAAVPLAFACPVTAVVASVGNLAALRGRIRTEERALEAASAATASGSAGA